MEQVRMRQALNCLDIRTQPLFALYITFPKEACIPQKTFRGNSDRGNLEKNVYKVAAICLFYKLLSK